MHPEMMYFEKKRGNNRYHIFAIKDGFDMKLAPDKHKDLWDVWELDNGNDFYDEMCKFYSDDPTSNATGSTTIVIARVKICFSFIRGM